MKDITNKATKAVLQIINFILIVVFAILSVINVLGTTCIDIGLNDYREYAYFEFDNYLKSFLMAMLFIIIIVSIDYFLGLDKINTHKLKRIAIIYVIAFGTIWVIMMRTHPVADQNIVQRIAGEFINEDYSAFSKGKYLYNFHHQIGIVFIFELVYRVFGVGNYQAIMLINVLCTAGIFNILYKILSKITDNRKVHNFYWIMVFGCFPLIFYSIFVYGTIIGLFFALTGIYFCYKYNESHKAIHYVVTFIAFSIAVVAKSNFIIFVIATILVMIFSSIKERQAKNIVFGLLLAITVMVPNVVTQYYIERTGMDIGKGATSSLYIAMGLQEGDKESACGADGWYNQYNVKVLAAAGYDADKADEMAKENISQRLSELASNPSMALDFAFEKITTQWAEPTFQTFWMMQANDNHGEYSEFATNIVEGKASIFILQFMKIYLMFMWIGNLVYFVANWNKLDIWKMVLSIVIIGGFIFHLFWEGKALYILPYFVVSMVAGVQGLMLIYEKTKDFAVGKIRGLETN